MLNLPRRFRFIIHKQKRRIQSDGRQLRSGWRRAFRRWRVVYVDVKSHANRGRKEQLSLKREKWAESHSGVAATLFKEPLIKWQSLYCLHMEDPIQHPATFCSPTHTAKIRAREREREGETPATSKKSGTEWSVSGFGRGWRRAFSFLYFLSLVVFSEQIKFAFKSLSFVTASFWSAWNERIRGSGKVSGLVFLARSSLTAECMDPLGRRQRQTQPD